MTTNLLRVLLLCAAALGCKQTSRDAPAAASDDAPAAASEVHQVALSGRRNLRESSGIAASRDHQGVVYTIDDSGNDPTLYAFDTTGSDRGMWRVGNATNRDWEAIATGPCGARSCVYIGDVGDNKASAPSRRIYRFSEPRDSTESIRADALEYTYPDGAHDVEAMFVTPASDLYLITKRPLTSGGNRLRPALVYALPAAAWKSGGAAKARLVDSLPIVPGAQPLMLVTDASLSDDGALLAVRTYTQTYIFRVDASTGRVDHSAKFTVCDISPLGEAQGEGIAWIGERRLAFSSEGKRQPLRLATCPVP